MKYINKIFFFIILFGNIILLNSCDSRLDIKPQDFIDESKAFQSLDDCNNTLGLAYSPLRGGGAAEGTGAYLPIIFDMMTDEMKETIPSSLGNFRPISDWYYAADNSIITNAWGLGYTSIMRSNLVLANVDRFASPANQTKVNRIKGQALALRAYVHFDLLRCFGQSYDRNSGTLGVPVVTTQGDPSRKPNRNTVKEVYDAIFQDLLQARTLLSNVDETIAISRLDLRAVNGLLARVSLYAGQWADAITYSTAVINTSSNLATGTTFTNIWARDIYPPNGEVLWAIPYISSAEGRLANFVITFASGNYNHSYIPTNALADLYNTSLDIRYSAYIGADLSLIRGVRKFIGRNGLTDGVVDNKALRLGEIYLIRAEAYDKSGNATNALADINTLRVARGLPTITGVSLTANIKAERRRELAFEGHRWFDIRRYGEGIMRGADWGAPSISQSLPLGNFRFVFPIPQGEILVNPNMVQNPGY
ncbi:MAG: RagB/SusD family nutrient uptake outer membrane protein [Bacteroidetes bacterium]|nr:MAG: RagB/SusD family nutrient uptake outer membrane protein [Bacteroidota bacterium]TAG88024.1 MAG: RagB/SusD family nutrient uptake outer membrane protein [Bacteroidota bacterium]